MVENFVNKIIIVGFIFCKFIFESKLVGFILCNIIFVSKWFFFNEIWLKYDLVSNGRWFKKEIIF